MWKKTCPYFLFQIIFYCGFSAFWKTLRLYRRWKSSFYSTPMGEGLPWLTFAAISFLEVHLRFYHRVFEWGGGGSTVYFTGRCARVVTVEDNPYWFGQIPPSENWSGFLRRCNVVVGVDDYVFAVSLFGQPFDLILVDGLARPDCIRAAPAYLKPGGLLVIDDAQRPEYREAIDGILDGFSVELSDYGPTPFHPDFKISLILRKRLQE